MNEHHYVTTVNWCGNRGTGTSSYTAYGRGHEISGPGKALVIPGSADPHFRGDPASYNPEELLLASLSACHLLWYLHLCAVNGVIVTDYRDEATGTMAGNPDGSGEFTLAILHPRVTVSAESDAGKALELHAQASKMCFIARSVRFPVQHEPLIFKAPDA